MNRQPERLSLTGEDRKPLHGQQGKWNLVEHLTSTVVHPLPLSVCCASRNSWLFCDPSTVPAAHCSAACPQSLMRRVLLSDECYWWMHMAMGKINACSLWHKQNHTSKHIHTDAQSYTASLRYVTVYICTVYPLCIVSDAVLCMLTCRWNVTIIHRRGCAGRPSHSTDSLNQCKLFVSSLVCFLENIKWHEWNTFTSSVLFLKVLFSQTAVQGGFKLFEETYNLTFDVRQNLAIVSAGRGRRGEGELGHSN